MGGAVSSGRDNNELVDNLMSGNYIRSRVVERVFRVLDRADYMSPTARDQAYKDLAWRNGPFHLSAPCIYSEVMEALELKPGLSFLNIGSGTGYLTTLVGLIIGSAGISHGVEAVPVVTEYATTKLGQFLENSATLDEFDFCMPRYYTGNGLCLALSQTYDRVYCGAGVLPKYENYFKQLTKVGGVLVMPLADTLVQMRRVTDTHWNKKNLLNVSFALLKEPEKEELGELVKLEEQSPPALQILCRGVVRAAMRGGVLRRHPELREPPPPPRPQPHHGLRRICIPIDADTDEEMNELHDLDEAGGAHEMNALLSLVLSMGQNRAAGSLRLDPVDDDYDRDYDDYDDVVQLDDFEAVRPDRADGPAGVPRRDGGVIVVDVGGAGLRHRPPRPHPPPPSAPARPDSSGPVTRSRARMRTVALKTTKTITKTKTVTKSKTVTKTKTKTVTEKQAKPATRSVTAAKNKANTETKPKSGTSTGTSTSTETDTSTKSGCSSGDAESRRGSALYEEDSSSADEENTQMKENKRQKLDSGIGEGTGSSSPKSREHTDGSERSHGESSDGDDTDMGWEDTTSDSSSDDEDDSGGGGRGAGGETSAREMKRKKLDCSLAGIRARWTCRASSEGPSTADTVTEGRRRLRAAGRGRGSSDSGAEEACCSRGLAEEACCSRGLAEEACCSRGHAEEACCSRGHAAPPPSTRDARRVRLSLLMKQAVKELPLPPQLRKFVNLGRCYEF